MLVAEYEQDRISRRDREAQRWVSARPAGPVRRLCPAEIARIEAERTGKPVPRPSEYQSAPVLPTPRGFTRRQVLVLAARHGVSPEEVEWSIFRRVLG